MRVMHSKSDNKEIMINDKADEVIRELFKPLKKYINLESVKGSEFVFDYVHYFKCLLSAVNVIKKIQIFVDHI